MLQSHHLALHRVLVTNDLLLVGTAVAFSRRYLAAGSAGSWADCGWQIAVAAVAWLVLSARLGLYRSRRTQGSRLELLALAETWVATLGLTVLFAQIAHGAPAFEPLIAAVTGYLGLATLRVTLRFSLRRIRLRGLNYRRALFVGGGESAVRLRRELRDNPQYGIVILGGIPLGEGEHELDDVRSMGGIADLERVLLRHHVDYVLLCPPDDARNADVLKVFEVCSEAGIRCHYAPGFLAAHDLVPALAWYGEIPALTFRHRRSTPWRVVAKRGIDLAVSGVALILLSPVMLAIAIAIKLQDRGPVLFVQERLGRHGRAFACFKFRTMCVGAERMQAELAAKNEQQGAAFKIKDDPRITRIGRLLRKHGLDELPQLFNVLIGNMSLVGPRPPIPEEVAKYDLWHRRRMSVPPGITGLWQVTGRTARVSFDQWVAMDLYYVDHWSLSMDFKLMLRTFGVVLRGTGT